MKQFHLIGTYGARPQSIKISQLNVREIKDDRTSVPAKCTFLQFRKNLFHLYNLLINNYWHTEFTQKGAHTTLCSVCSRKDAKGRKETENDERWTMKDESSEEKSRSEVLKFWGERWKMNVERLKLKGKRWEEWTCGVNFAPLCAFAWGQNQLAWTFHPDGARAKRIAILCVLWFLCAQRGFESE